MSLTVNKNSQDLNLSGLSIVEMKDANPSLLQKMSHDVRRGVVFPFLEPKDITRMGSVNRFFKRVNFNDLCAHFKQSCTTTLCNVRQYKNAFHVQNLFDMYRNFPDLLSKTKSLKLDDKDIQHHDPKANEIFNSIPPMPNLTKISLFYCCLPITNTLIARLPSKFPKLTDLILTGSGIDNPTLSSLAAQIPSLTGLSLDGSNYIDSSGIVDIMGKLRCIQRLSLHSVPIELTGLKAIQNNCSNLTHFELSDNTSVDDAYIKGFTEKFTHLIKLSLPGCVHISDVALEAIGQNCKRLEILELEKTNITDKGIGYFVEGCREIKHVRLDYCEKITTQGIIQLGMRLPKLERLDFFPSYGVSLNTVHCQIFLAKAKPELNAGDLSARYQREFAYNPRTEAGKLYHDALEAAAAQPFSKANSLLQEMSNYTGVEKLRSLEKIITARMEDNREQEGFKTLWKKEFGNTNQDNLCKVADALHLFENREIKPEKTL